jgi:diguanylate cyclase (GGDEF)-like protein/hemerythrin-like metal-binding protein
MRTLSFAMVFVAATLHLAGKDQGLAVWAFLVALFLVYPHIQYWRSPIKVEMTNLLVDSVLLGIFVTVVEFADWLAFSVVLATLINNAANKGWRGIRESIVALLAGVLIGVAVGGFRFAPHTDWPATLFCILGLGGYLLAMNNIGYSRNLQLRRTREQLQARERELIGANAALLKNLQEIDELQGQLREQANRDPLTGLYNRRFLDTTLARELARCNREGKSLSLVMIDVDYFKKFNDHYGHQAGDECLKIVAHALRASARRASDLAARYGGEEFFLVLADTDAATAKRLAEEVRRSIELLDLPHERSRWGRLTISVGVATMTNETYRDVDSLLRAADAALYRAKHSGRNQVQAASEVSPGTGDGEHSAIDPVELVWHAAYECGLAAIDEPHRDLFAQGNIIHAAIASGRPRDEIAELVDALIRELFKHFHEEDAIITSAGFPDAAEHAAIHREFMDRAVVLASRFRARELDTEELFRFLAHEVVVRHMLEADRAFLPYLQREAAFA